jgi:hypothetical protein
VKLIVKLGGVSEEILMVPLYVQRDVWVEEKLGRGGVMLPRYPRFLGLFSGRAKMGFHLKSGRGTTFTFPSQSWILCVVILLNQQLFMLL